MNLKGRAINVGYANGVALVLDFPFSFIGDFDPATGILVMDNHPLQGRSIAGKILVCPTGKGGTIAPFIAYQAKLAGKAPAAILCEKADPILCECALVINIPIIDTFDKNLQENIRTGQTVTVEGGNVSIDPLNK